MSDRHTATRLYISNIRRNSRESDIRRLFEPIGRLESFVYYGDDESYCEFRRHEDAEYAIRKLDGYPFEGRRLLVEWALVSLNRRSQREPRESREPRERLEDKKCYICGETGHIQRECREFKRRSDDQRPRERGEDDLGRRRDYEEPRAESRREDKSVDRQEDRSVDGHKDVKEEEIPREVEVA
jgi:RNA recognition motif-containing protein